MKTFFKSGEILEGRVNLKSNKVYGYRWAPTLNDGTYDKYEVENYGFKEKMAQENFPEQLIKHLSSQAEDEVELMGQTN